MRAWWAFAALAAAAKQAAKDPPGFWTTTNAKGEKIMINEKTGDELLLKVPELSEDEQKHSLIPHQHRCDACMAVSFRLSERLSKKETTLSSWEYTDLLEQACEDSFPPYGMRIVKGVNKLIGPGIFRDDEPGENEVHKSDYSVKWHTKIQAACREVVFGTVGEDEVYNLRKASDFGGALCKKAVYCTAEEVAAAVEDRAAHKELTQRRAVKEKEAKKEAKVKGKEDQKVYEEKVIKARENADFQTKAQIGMMLTLIAGSLGFLWLC